MKNRKLDKKGMVSLAVSAILIAACSLLAVGCSSDTVNDLTLPIINISMDNTNEQDETGAWACDGTGMKYTIKEDVQVIGTSSTGKMITFDIQNGAKVVWRAKIYSSSPQDISPLYNHLVVLTNTGDGTFQVLSGEIIQKLDGCSAIFHNNFSDSKITIEIKGGKVSKSGEFQHAISSAGAKVIVSGGTVSASGGKNNAICANGDVIVSGGTIETNGKDSIALAQEGSDVSVTLSGGTLKSSGENARAIATNCVIMVDGIVTLSGLIYCNGITVNSGGKLTLMNGTVLDIFDYLIDKKGLTNNGKIINNGIINIYGAGCSGIGTITGNGTINENLIIEP